LNGICLAHITNSLFRSTCIEQDVEWFETKQDCNEMLQIYSEMPADGDWDTVEYICKPVGSTSI